MRLCDATLRRRLIFSLLMTAALAIAGTPPCPVPFDPTIEVYPTSPLNYPVPSDQYAVQYKLNDGDWTDAMVYISKYGATVSSPYHTYSHYPKDQTSMSFVSVPVGARTSVALRVSKKALPGFPASGVSIRPRASGVVVGPVAGSTVELSTKTSDDFAGQQFILWWDGGDPEQNAGVQGLAVFLDPVYEKPSGRVKTISVPGDLKDVSEYDALDFEGTIGGTDPIVFTIPGNIQTVFLGPGSWLRGKMRFAQSGNGLMRRLYGPGVLDASRFDYSERQCRDSSDPKLQEEGFQALSFGDTKGTLDQFQIDGIVIADFNYYSTSSLKNATINNMKIIGWNGNNDGFQFGVGTRAFNIFVRTGDDSLKMWDSSITVTNATVWQNFNGGVVNLGWIAATTGDDCRIDGLYVVKTDWVLPAVDSWIFDPKNPLNGQNNAVIASMQTPGTMFGSMHRSTFRNIYVEDTPRVLFSLKILPPDCNLTGGNCPTFNPALASMLNLNVENMFAPASVLDNSIGFQTYQDDPNGVATLTGSMKVGLRNVILTLPDGTVAPLTEDTAGFVGKIGTNGSNIDIDYKQGESPTPLSNWFSAWTAGQGAHFPSSSLPAGASTVRMVVRPVISGSSVRVKVENVNGVGPVSFSAAYIGRLQAGAAIVDGTNTRLTFNDGSPGVTLAPGAGAYSDPVHFPVTAFTRYAVSLDVVAPPDNISGHTLGLVTNYMAAGSHAADPSGAGFTAVPNPDPSDLTYPFYWVAALDVASDSAAGTLVALGDSITDGKCSTRNDLTGMQTPDQYLRWTDLLALRFAQLDDGQPLAVVNEGIAGNTVFGGGNGLPALIRLENDVLFREGVKYVIFFEGTNDIADDIGAGALPDPLITSLISAGQLVIARAHTAGVKIVGATILPRGAQKAWSADMEKVRVAVNDWIRHQANFDGVIDFDALMTDGATNAIPAIQQQWLCGDKDGVHPNAAGYAWMAAHIDLGLFRPGNH